MPRTVAARGSGSQRYLTSGEKRFFRMLKRGVAALPDKNMGWIENQVEADMRKQFWEDGRRLTKGGDSGAGYWLKNWTGSKDYEQKKQKDGYGGKLLLRTGRLYQAIPNAAAKMLRNGSISVKLAKVKSQKAKLRRAGKSTISAGETLSQTVFTKHTTGMDRIRQKKIRQKMAWKKAAEVARKKKAGQRIAKRSFDYQAHYQTRGRGFYETARINTVLVRHFFGLYEKHGQRLLR